VPNVCPLLLFRVFPNAVIDIVVVAVVAVVVVVVVVTLSLLSMCQGTSLSLVLSYKNNQKIQLHSSLPLDRESKTMQAANATSTTARPDASIGRCNKDTEARRPTKTYWIDCSDTGHVVMDDIRLEAMFEKMPTLKFLLMGHPNMKAKATRQNEETGAEILTIPAELEISKSSFLLLVNCLFGAVPLPRPAAPESRHLELTETIATLGGCQELELQIQHLRCDPTTPEDDVHQEFYWANLPGYTGTQTTTVFNMREQGYSWVKSVENAFPGGHRTDHIFRAPKNPPPVPPRPNMASTQPQQVPHEENYVEEEYEEDWEYPQHLPPPMPYQAYFHAHHAAGGMYNFIPEQWHENPIFMAP
jgi:hypothetical protein